MALPKFAVPLALRASLTPLALCASLTIGACTKKADVVPPGEAADAHTPVAGAGKAPVDKPPVGRAQVSIMPLGTSKVSGTLVLTALQDGAGVQVQGALSGLTPGRHGIHVHEVGDCSAADGSSAGGHFNPTQAGHGAPDDAHSHVGDLGNLVANAEGRASLDIIKKSATLGSGATDLVGRSIIVHADADDLHSQPTGNSGGRVACGKVQAL